MWGWGGVFSTQVARAAEAKMVTKKVCEKRVGRLQANPEGHTIGLTPKKKSTLDSSRIPFKLGGAKGDE